MSADVTNDRARQSVVDMLANLQGGTYDRGGPPPTSPQDLASISSFAVRGTVESVRSGRMLGYEPTLLHSVVLELAVDEALVGSLTDGGAERVYVEFFPHAPGVPRAAEIDALVPRGAKAVAYLVAAQSTDRPPDYPDGWPYIHNPDAGRPAGEPIWWLADPIGLIVEDMTFGLIRSGDLVTFPGGEISDAVPSGDFPASGPAASASVTVG